MRSRQDTITLGGLIRGRICRLCPLLRSLRTLTKRRLALKAMESRLDADERKVMEAMSRVLEGSGYRVVPVKGNEPDSERPRRSRRRLARQDLKCPKCDRRFAFVMHVARHMNAMHPTRKGRAKKAAA